MPRRKRQATEAKRVSVTPSGSTELYRSIAAADAEGQTELHKAARSGGAHAIEFAELLLDDGADINERTAQLRTPLQIAIIFRNFEMASMLLGRGADADTQDVHGRSPLLDAVVTADAALVTTLLDRMRTLFGAPPDDAEIRYLIPAAARGFAADRDAAPLPPALRRFADVFPVVPLKAALSLGVRGQWNDVHRHTTAVFTQVAGTKGWALWPPFTPRSTLDAAKLTSAAADETSRDTMCGLFGVGGGNVSALLRHRGLRLCELQAGEALVIPTFGERHRGGWWHGTCNLGEWTAGFTTFHFPPA